MSFGKPEICCEYYIVTGGGESNEPFGVYTKNPQGAALLRLDKRYTKNVDGGILYETTAIDTIAEMLERRGDSYEGKKLLPEITSDCQSV